jgi:hypothetical protein
MLPAVVLQTGPFELPGERLATLYHSFQADVGQIQMRQEKSVGLEPADRAANEIQLVADVVQSMHASDQVEGLVWRPLMQRRRLELDPGELYGNRPKHIHQINADDLPLVSCGTYRQSFARFNQGLAGAAAQIEPGYRVVLLQTPLEKLSRSKPRSRS